MASTEIKVSLERLLSARDVISAEANNFVECMSEIETHMAYLDSVWDGSSADGFLEQFRKIKANVDSYKIVIDEQAASLTKASEYYEQRESVILGETAKLSNAELFA